MAHTHATTYTLHVIPLAISLIQLLQILHILSAVSTALKKGEKRGEGGKKKKKKKITTSKAHFEKQQVVQSLCAANYGTKDLEMLEQQRTVEPTS